MFFLQVNNQPQSISLVLFFGTIGMLALAIGLIVFIIFHQRKVIRYQLQLQKLEQDQQKVLLNASIRLQEEERQRSAINPRFVSFIWKGIKREVDWQWFTGKLEIILQDGEWTLDGLAFYQSTSIQK